jgi:hypothetical protein
MAGKEYSLNGIAGLIQTRRCHVTGTTISIYHNEQAGLDCGCTFMAGKTEHDPEHHNPYSTVCEDHGQLVIHKTLSLARSHAPMPEWCEACQKIMEAKGLYD